MKTGNWLYIVFILSFTILLYLLFKVHTNTWKQVIVYLIGANTLILGQLAKNSFDSFREKAKEKVFIKNLLESINQEINLFETNYIQPIDKKLNEINDKPLRGKYPISHKSFSIYFSNITHILFIKSHIRKNIISCYNKLSELVDGIIKHNNEYEIFYKTFINQGISTNGIENYDPSKNHSFTEINKKYKELVSSTEFVKDLIEKAKSEIEKATNQINAFINRL